MEPVKLEGFSKNMSYLFTNKGVTKVSLELNDLNGRNYVPYTFEHLNIAVDILKENLEFNYKIGKLSLQEYTSEPRKFLNYLVEEFNPENKIKLVKEWEEKFGSKLLLINESVDNLIVEARINESWESFKIILEQWYNPFSSDFAVYQGAKNVYNWGKEKGKQFDAWGREQAKQIKDKGLLQWGKEKASAVWGYVKEKIADAWNCVKSGIECIMEGMRSLVFSAAGTAILTGVSFIPVVGQVTNGIIFGSLLIWDIYKGLSGKGWDIVNIIVDAIALLAPAIGKVVKTAFVGIKSFAQLGAAAVSKGGIFAKVFNILKSGINTLKGFIGKAATWLGDKLGLKSLQAWGVKVEQKMSSMVDDMSSAAGGKPVVASTSTSVKNLTAAQKSEYDKLLTAWKQGRQSLGKSTKPNQNVRAKLLKMAQEPKSFSQKVKDIWKGTTAKSLVVLPPSGPATFGTVTTAMGKQFVLTAAFCAALGLDGFTCKEKIENGQVSEADLERAQQEVQERLSQAIDDTGGFENLEFDV